MYGRIGATLTSVVPARNRHGAAPEEIDCTGVSTRPHGHSSATPSIQRSRLAPCAIPPTAGLARSKPGTGSGSIDVNVSPVNDRKATMTTTLKEVSAPANLLSEYSRVRAFTESLCEGLAAEDYVVQSMPDVSPTKWHLAHTSWFFEAFVLMPHLAQYRPLNPVYHYLFNSYYVQAGERHCRAQRGYLSRPTVREVMAYRTHVDRAMEDLLGGEFTAAVSQLVTLGLHHEQQHQELMLTDIKHVFSVNPLRPVYRKAGPTHHGVAAPLRWIAFAGGVQHVGHEGTGFSFDNETPRHREFVEPFEIASRLVTNGEYLEFM